MKRVLVLTVVIFLSGMLISCKNTQNTVDNSDFDDTGNTGNTGDTVNTGDTDTNADTDLDDNGNTADDSDTDTGDTGNTGEMVDVPAGIFQMGCNEAVDDKCSEDEYPYHEVELSAYKIDKYEVTADEYQKCVDSGYCNNDSESEPHYYTNEDDSFCNLGATDKGDHPMNCVSWFGAKEYCAWAGKRLPTEAEWEKAARGTEGAKYPWGNEHDANCEYAVMEENSLGCGTKSTWVVGSKEKGKSPYGTYDMSGNVSEWVSDWYSEDYYRQGTSYNPEGYPFGNDRVVRGGSWTSSDIDYLQTSTRSYSKPHLRLSSYGFRCAKKDDALP